MPEPVWTYDKAAEMGYLKLSDEKAVDTYRGWPVRVDLDEAGRLVGIEVLL